MTLFQPADPAHADAFMPHQRNQELAKSVRSALLMAIDALEIWLGVEPRTSEMRRFWRKNHDESDAT